MDLESMDQAALIKYVKSLREEAKGNREAVAKYDSAFGNLPDNEQKTFLHMVQTYREDNDAGADLFRRMADAVKPLPKETTPVTTPVETKPADAPAADDPIAQLTAAVAALAAKFDEGQTAAKETAEQASQREILAEIDALGYKPETDEFKNFMRYAQITDSLADADEMFKTMHPAAPGEAEATATAPVTTEQKFPKSAAVGSGSAPAATETAPEEPDLSTSGSRLAAALDRVKLLTASDPVA